MSISIEKVFDKFIKIENKNILFDLQISGVYFWEHIREDVYSEILLKLGLMDKAHDKIEKSPKVLIKQVINSIFNYLLKNPLIAKPATILFWGSPVRRKEDDGYYWDIYFDPIIEKIQHSYVLLEKYFQRKHFYPPKTQNIKYLDILELLAWLYRRFVRIHINEREMGAIRDIEHEIKREFGCTIGIASHILTKLYNRKTFLGLYMRVLKRIRPKMVMLIVGSSKEILIEACRCLKIPTVELQHGNLSKYAIGYAFPGGKRKYGPDYFFSFGKYWEVVTRLPFKKQSIFTIGYPYLEYKAAKCSNVKKEDQVLFISQGTIGKELSKFAVGLHKLIGNKVKIVYKLHPGEILRWKEEYPWLAESGIEIIYKQEPSLYDLMAESRWQVGVYSTAVYEGLVFGCHTYLVNLPGVEHMRELAESGHVTIVNTPDEVKLNKKKKPIRKDYFFKSHYEENIFKAIEFIFEKTASSRL